MSCSTTFPFYIPNQHITSPFPLIATYPSLGGFCSVIFLFFFTFLSLAVLVCPSFPFAFHLHSCNYSMIDWWNKIGIWNWSRVEFSDVPPAPRSGHIAAGFYFLFLLAATSMSIFTYHLQN